MDELNYYTIDNNGTFYVSGLWKKNPKQFRLSCYLNDLVDKNVLLQALEETIQVFPYFHVSLRRGLFWHYLEESKRKPYVKQENKPICCRLVYNGDDLLYRVSFYKKRINLEVSHILSDGRGAFIFFKYLITDYIKIKYHLNIELKTDSTTYDNIEDSYDKYFQKVNSPKSKNKDIYHYKAKKLNNKTRYMECFMNKDDLLALSHKYNVSLTIYLVALLIKTIKEQMSYKDLNKEIIIEIPVDLREFYKSNSIKNFFGLVMITYKEDSTDLKYIIKEVEKQFKDKININSLSLRMNKMEGFQKLMAARLLPLFIKMIGLRIITLFTSKGTAQISNVGVIKLPKEVDKYIDRISAMANTDSYIFDISTYKDKLCLCISSIYKYNIIITNFLKALRDENIDIEIYTCEA